jgi:hypothetical protein
MLITNVGKILVVNKHWERNNISSRLLLIEKEQDNKTTLKEEETESHSNVQRARGKMEFTFEKKVVEESLELRPNVTHFHCKTAILQSSEVC